jgi:hypothetical protein
MNLYLRKDMWDALVDIMGDAAVAEVTAKPAAGRLEAILGGHDWNGSRTACKKWLASTWPDC